MAQLKAYLRRRVAKVFPGFNDGEPFPGEVDKLDPKDAAAPFHIQYEDGDEEWVGLDELLTILVDGDGAAGCEAGAEEAAPQAGEPQKGKRGRPPKTNAKRAPAEPKAAAEQPSSKKHKSSSKRDKAATDQGTPQDAATVFMVMGVAAPNAEAGTSAAAAAAAADKPAAFDAELAKRQLKQQQQQGKGAEGLTNFTIMAGAAARVAAAAKAEFDAAAGLSGAKPAVSGGAAASGGAAKSSGRTAAGAGASGSGAAAAKSGLGKAPAAPTAGASGAAAAAKSGSKAAPGTPGGVRGGVKQAGANMASPSVDTLQLAADIHRAAGDTAKKMEAHRHVARMPYKGSGAAALPAMSQMVVARGTCYITVYGGNRVRGSTPGRGLTGPDSAGPDYQAEAEAALQELDRHLQQCSSSKAHLVKVRVFLRSMVDGWPGFTDAWNAWADRTVLPVVTIIEGAGPFTSSGIVLEAEAMVE